MVTSWWKDETAKQKFQIKNLKKNYEKILLSVKYLCIITIIKRLKNCKYFNFYLKFWYVETDKKDYRINVPRGKTL